MYYVLGCSSCNSYFIGKDIKGQKTITCGRCGTSKKIERRRNFFKSEDKDEALAVMTKLQIENVSQNVSERKMKNIIRETSGVEIS